MNCPAAEWNYTDEGTYTKTTCIISFDITFIGDDAGRGPGLLAGLRDGKARVPRFFHSRKKSPCQPNVRGSTWRRNAEDSILATTETYILSSCADVPLWDEHKLRGSKIVEITHPGRLGFPESSPGKSTALCSHS
jgi:hypothetical protein